MLHDKPDNRRDQEEGDDDADADAAAVRDGIQHAGDSRCDRDIRQDASSFVAFLQSAYADDDVQNRGEKDAYPYVGERNRYTSGAVVCQRTAGDLDAAQQEQPRRTRASTMFPTMRMTLIVLIDVSARPTAMVTSSFTVGGFLQGNYLLKYGNDRESCMR